MPEIVFFMFLVGFMGILEMGLGQPEFDNQKSFFYFKDGEMFQILFRQIDKNSYGNLTGVETWKIENFENFLPSYVAVRTLIILNCVVFILHLFRTPQVLKLTIFIRQSALASSEDDPEIQRVSIKLPPSPRSEMTSSKRSARYVIPQRRWRCSVKNCESVLNWRIGRQNILYLPSTPIHQNPEPLVEEMGASLNLSSSSPNFLGGDLSDLDKNDYSDTVDNSSTTAIEKQEVENNFGNDEDEDGFEIVTRRKKSRPRPEVQKMTVRTGLLNLVITTKRAETHFVEPGTDLRNLKDIKNYVKFWKNLEGNEWNLPKNFRKTIFPHELKGLLQEKVENLLKNCGNYYQLSSSVSPSGSSEELVTYLSLLDKEEKHVIDLGHSEAVQLTRRPGCRRITSQFLPQTRVQFVPYNWRQPQNEKSSPKFTNHFHLHFNTQFVSHFGSAQNSEEVEGLKFEFMEPDNYEESDSDDFNCQLIAPQGHKRLIERSKPYLFVDFISCTFGAPKRAGFYEMTK